MKLTKEQLKDILARAGKTFIQAFLSSISIDALLGVTDFDTLKRIGVSILIAGVAAGISAVWNSAQDCIIAWVEKKFMPTKESIAESIQEGLNEYDEV